MPHKITQQEAESRFRDKGLLLLSPYGGKDHRVLARCRCGNEFWPFAGNVFRGYTTSCGCVRRLRSSQCNRLSQEEAEARFRGRGLALISPYSGNSSAVVAVCPCGATFSVTPAAVFSGRQKLCQKCSTKTRSQRHLKNITGHRFGYLLAMAPTGDKQDGKAMWRCSCKCGNVCIVRVTHLLSGATKSCGCLNDRTGQSHPNWKGFEAISGRLWAAIHRSAANRGWPFEVSPQECWSKFCEQNGRCALSNVDIALMNSESNRNADASLDRIDSRRGYSKDNVQWVHKVINRLKWRLPQARFVELCKFVVEPIESDEPSAAAIIERPHPRFRGCGNLGLSYWREVVAGSREGYPRRRRNIVLAITIEDAWRKFLAQKGRCALTGLPLDWTYYVGRDRGGKPVRHLGSASLDRIDNAAGYTPSNIQWVHKEINIMRGDLSIEAFRHWCRLVVCHSARVPLT